MSKPILGQNPYLNVGSMRAGSAGGLGGSLLGGFAGAVAQGPQGGNNLRFNPGGGIQSTADMNATPNPYMGGNTPKPIKYQGITPRDPATGMVRPEFGYGVGAAGWNSGQQQQWVNQNGLWYGPNGQQLDDATYRRTAGALSGGPGSSSFNSSYSAGGGMGGYQAAFDQAKAANEARYNQLLSEGEQNRGRMMGYLDGAGNTERADLEKAYSAKQGTLQSRMNDYGLGGTSVTDSLSSGLQQAQNRDTSALNERLQGQRLNLDNMLSQQRAGVIERREDPYPSPEMAASIQANSQSNSSGGGAYGNTVPASGFGGGGYGMDWQSGPGGRGGGFVRRQDQNLPFNGTPTGVNLEYLTPAALNDPSYMDAFKRTQMTRPPRMLQARQYSS